jgi:PleD family two-component response regulator
MLCVIHDITEQKRLKAELEQAALKDPLTGLWNRRHLLLQLERSIQEKQRFGNDFSLILLDADNFKHINDRYGHFTGDEVLVWLAKTLESRVRAVDSVCRWGARSSSSCCRKPAATMPCTWPSPAPDRGTNAPRQAARHHGQHWRGHPPGQETVESLIMRVDSALYQAKNQGRNCVMAA